MKIFENISIGYKKIAAGIAIVSFLAIMYMAMIPGALVAAQSFVIAASGTPIAGAFVKIVEWPQYNATTAADGTYAINNVPYDSPGGTTYTLRTRAAGYALNTSQVTINGGQVIHNISLTPGVSYTAAGQIYGGQWRTDFRVGNLGNQSTTLDCKFLNTSGITKNNSEHVMSSMSSEDHIWSDWVTNVTGDAEGSATISSEQKIDVITMQRSSSAGKIGFFEGAPLNLQGTQWFMPGLIYGGQWRSGFKVLNLGTINADVSIYFYNSTGGLVTTKNNITVPPKASPYYDWYSNGYNVSGGSTDGTATIVSNNAQNLSVTATQASESTGRLGFWNGIYLNDTKTDVFVTGQIWTTTWRSGFKVANLGSTDADVTMYFYNSTGGLINTRSVIIPPKASPYYDWYSNGYNVSGGSSDGTVRVRSNNAVQLYITESQASEAAGFLDFYQAAEINGNKTAGLIYLKFEGGERSGFKIANPSDSQTITATIRFYNATGGLVNTTTSNVAAKASPYYAWSSYSTEPFGSVSVDASGRISVVANFASDTESKLGIFKGIEE